MDAGAYSGVVCDAVRIPLPLRGEDGDGDGDGWELPLGTLQAPLQSQLQLQSQSQSPYRHDSQHALMKIKERCHAVHLLFLLSLLLSLSLSVFPKSAMRVLQLQSA